MYFVLEHIQERFQYVKYGVGVLLMFTGVKLLSLIFDFHISTVASIIIIFSVILISVILSLVISKKQEKKGLAEETEDQ